MKKFKRISSYNKTYVKLIDDSIRKMLPLIIEASVNVFGEKHRPHISYVLNNLNFAYTLSEDYIKALLKKPKGLSKKYIYLLNYYSKYLNYMNHHLHSRMPQEDREIKDFCYIGANYQEYDLEEDIINHLDEDCAFYFSILGKDINDKKEICDVVALPIMGLGIKTIFHELTHALTTFIIGYMNKELIYIEVFPNEEVMELVNEYTSSLILKEYLRLGGIIPKVFQNIDLYNIYHETDILIVDFFEEFKDLILEATITGSANILISRVGEENFLSYCDLVATIFRRNTDIIQEDYDAICHIVDKMLDYEYTTKPFNSEKYFQELESAGFRIRKLK